MNYSRQEPAAFFLSSPLLSAASTDGPSALRTVVLMSATARGSIKMTERILFAGIPERSTKKTCAAPAGGGFREPGNIFLTFFNYLCRRRLSISRGVRG